MRCRHVAILLVLCACGSDRVGARLADAQRAPSADERLLVEVASLRARQAQLETYAAQRPLDEQQISANASALGDAGDPSVFLMRLQELSFELNMELVRLTPLPEALHETYVETAYDVTVRATFVALLPFLRAIARSGVAVVEDLRLTPGADGRGRPNVTATFRLRTFRWAAPTPSSAGAPKAKARLPDAVPRPRRIANTARVSLDDALFAVADPFVARAVPPGGVGRAGERPPAPCVFEPYVVPSSGRRIAAIAPGPVPVLPLDPAQRAQLQAERDRLTVAMAEAEEIERAARALERRARRARELAVADAVPVWMLADLARLVDGKTARIMSSQVAECLGKHPEAQPATEAPAVWLASLAEHGGELTLTGHAASHAAVHQLVLRLNTSLHFSRVAVRTAAPAADGTLPFTLTALVAY